MAKKHSTALGGDEELGPVAEINITPMVDVMLVLLIIFMVTAPLMMSQLPITLPKPNSSSSTPPHDPMVVSISRDGRYFIDPGTGVGPVEVPWDKLRPQLIELAQAEPDSLVFVSGAKNIEYGRVVDLIGIVGSTGFSKVSLQSKPAETP